LVDWAEKSPCHVGALVWRYTLPILKLLEGGKLMENLYVGIDVSKEHSTAQGIDGRGKKLFYLEIPMDSHGFSELLKAIKLESKAIDKVTVAMESTACYHINLFSFLTSKGIKVFVVNPLLISNFVKL
jgi:transposase